LTQRPFSLPLPFIPLSFFMVLITTWYIFYFDSILLSKSNFGNSMLFCVLFTVESVALGKPALYHCINAWMHNITYAVTI
jgi:hypothetical protein